MCRAARGSIDQRQQQHDEHNRYQQQLTSSERTAGLTTRGRRSRSAQLLADIVYVHLTHATRTRPSLKQTTKQHSHDHVVAHIACTPSIRCQSRFQQHFNRTGHTVHLVPTPLLHSAVHCHSLLPLSTAMSGLPFTARALFDYEAVESTELNLTTGDTVSIEEVNESGWSLARLLSSVTGQPTADRIGWIPTEYIERVGGDTVTAIAVERPQPLSTSQPIAMSEVVVDDVEEEVAALTITTALAPASASTAAAITVPPTPTAVLPATPKSTTAPPVAPTAASTKVCAHCHESIRSAFVMARDQIFHPNHFLCHTCHTPLGGKPYLEHDTHFYCEADYYEQFNPKCHTCHTTIKGAYVSALAASYHPHCFTCAHCHQPFTDNHYRQHNGQPYCETHFAELFAPPCAACKLPITSAIFEALDNKYHLECFVCSEGNHPIGENVLFHLHEGRVYCPEHFEAKFLQLCVHCKKGIRSQYVKVGDDMYHSECWQCGECRCVLRVDNCAQLDDRFYCKVCVVDKRRQASPLAALASTGPSSYRSSRAASAVSSPLPSRQTALAAAANVPPPITATPAATASADVVPLDPAAATATDTAATPAAEPYVEPSSGLTVSYSALKGTEQRPKGVDPRRKECYMADDEFVTVFGMARTEFDEMPAWKRNEHKKRVGLF